MRECEQEERDREGIQEEGPLKVSVRGIERCVKCVMCQMPMVRGDLADADFHQRCISGRASGQGL